jgi:flagellar hook-associated protein FlgK
MSSLITGINTALSSLKANTVGIDTTSHNIANMNDADYSKQLADLVATQAMTSIGSAGQIGTGVAVGSIERIRDTYLDRAIMQQWQNVGKAEILDRTNQDLASIFPEVNGATSTGIQSELDQFFSDWTTLSTEAQKAAAGQPNNLSAAQSAVYSAADTLAKNLNAASEELTNMQISLNTDLKTAVQNANTYIKEISDLNKQIVTISGLGQNPNDLLDKRTAAINDLAELININVSNRADGSVVVMMNGLPLVSGADGYNSFTTVGAIRDSKLESLGLVMNGSAPVAIKDSDVTDGKISGILQSRDETVPWYSTQLDSLANSLITVVNEIHSTANGTNFFQGERASNIAVSTGLLNGQNVAYTRYQPPTAPATTPVSYAGDLAAIIGSLGNKLVNNFVTSRTTGLNSNTQLGTSGTLVFNGSISVSYKNTDTISDLVHNINSHSTKFSAVYDDTKHIFYMVSDEPVTIEERGVDGLTPVIPPALMNKLQLTEQQTSSAPVNYADSLFGSSIVTSQMVNGVMTNTSWDDVELTTLDVNAQKIPVQHQVDVQTTGSGVMTMEYNGQQYTINWKSSDDIINTIGKIFEFNYQATPPANLTPMLAIAKLDPVSQKFVFGTDVVSSGTNRLLPFQLVDVTGNMTQVMKLGNNISFDSIMPSATGKLAGDMQASSTVLTQAQDSLTQLQTMQNNITKVDETAELAQAKLYQRAYDASVKLMDVIDEMLNMLINNTGTSSSTSSTSSSL